MSPAEIDGSIRLISLARDTADGSKVTAIVLGDGRATVALNDAREPSSIARDEAIGLVRSFLAHSSDGTIPDGRIPLGFARRLADVADMLGLPPNNGIRSAVSLEVADFPDIVRTTTIVHFSSGASLAWLGGMGSSEALFGGGPEEVVEEAMVRLGLAEAR